MVFIKNNNIQTFNQDKSQTDTNIHDLLCIFSEITYRKHLIK